MVGLVLIFTGFFIRTLDVGSCPSETPSHFVPCYHTFPNTDIYIWPTGTFVAEIGFEVLIVGIATFFYGHVRARKKMKTVPTAVSRTVGVLAIILVIVAGLLGFTLSNFSVPNQGATTIVRTTTETTTLTEIRLQPQPTVTATTTVARVFGQVTITEVLITAIGTVGGGGFCQGNLSAPEGCQGGATLEVTYSNSTSYILPSTLNNVILNATVTSVTSFTTMTCGNASTSFTTLSYNSTSGYAWVQWTWSQTCH